ncbi:DELTA-alicitoxin-Pse2b-like [Porites lutea]|uniref:DELTA-alicitoxin-Pse2b-like n=1 Tax=Porites lutea TaxID=51062 RepID=UPI003CC53976
MGFGATAKGHFQACALRHFGAFLLPAAVVEVAVAICLNSLFLYKYGSHVITSVNRRASIKQTTFAKSSNSYSERDFQVKSCVSFAGPTTVGKVGVKACANVSKTEISKATHMNTEDKLIIRGGTVNTRSALRTSRTKELIEQFLNEAKDSNEGVQHTFKSIWNLLQDRFAFGSNNNIKAVNLQYYYLGFLNYGCSFEESGGVSIQKFDYSKESTKESPEFECTLAAKGCHSSNDCHYKPVWCSCYGPSCVKYETVKQDTCGRKISAVANYNEYWGWHGCGWQVAGSYCNCYNGNKGSRRTVWTLPSRDHVQGGSAQSAAQHKSDNQDKSQELKIEVRILQIQAKKLQGQAGTLQDQAGMPDGIQLLKANMKTLKLQIKETNLKRSLFIRMN